MQGSITGTITSCLKKPVFAFLYVYYFIKTLVLRIVVGDEALAYVLYDSLVPHLVLKLGGAKIGKNVRINRWLMLHESRGSFRNLEIGDDVHIGKGVLIDLSGKVKIGNRVGLGMFSKILTHQNLGDSRLSEKYPPVKGDIVIPDDAVISSGSFVLYPTEFTEGTLVSAGSVVRGSYDKPYVLIGNPARPAVDMRRKQDAQSDEPSKAAKDNTER